MERGVRRSVPGPADSLAGPATQARTPEDLAGLLRNLRRRHARSRRDSTLTYRELAARTGWSQTAIAEYFTARTLPPTDRLDALLEVLGAAPAERRALADARDRVEEAGRAAKKRRPAVSAAPPALPRQLPAAPRWFTGRTRELARLDAALAEPPESGGTLVISAIGGTGGIGKTWLALHWAHRNQDRFPDGQLYVNLRGFDPTGQPLAPATAVRGFLEALGAEPGAIPAELDARVGLYRSLLAGKHMLILLDNARDSAQVAPLLPGSPTCTVLVTSRQQLTGLIATHGARPVDLDVLSPDEARGLLARRLGRTRLEAEPDAVTALLGQCAGLPLALGIVAARATGAPGLPLTALAAELDDHAGRLDALDAGEPYANLRAVLSWSSHALSPEAAGAFALLGLAPGPDLALPAAASLLGLPVATTRALLRELEHAHLIQRHAQDRYLMHDLLRLHAAEQAGSLADRQAALRRLVDFAVHTAYAAGRLLAPQHPAPNAEPVAAPVAYPLPDAAAALAWFDAEHTGLLAIQRLAAGQGWDGQVCHLAWALDPYHRRRGHLADQATSWQLAVRCADRTRQPAWQIRAHQLLGDAYAQLGRTTDALEELGQALAFAERTGDVESQADIHHSLGGTWERHGDDRKALEHAQEALLIFRTLGDAYRHARALNGVGWLRARLGEYAEARRDCEAALALLRQHSGAGGRLGESSTLDSLGYIAYHLKDYDQALDHYHRALAISRAHGQSYLEADLLDHIAETRLARHDVEAAREAWRRALELYRGQHRMADAGRVSRRLSEPGADVGVVDRDQEVGV
jgi:tetratricopeptide (TPR) repeat protein/transcriptional regulator with XRE-family HTH domain